MFTNDYSLAESGAKTSPVEKEEDNKESKSKETGKQKNEITIDAAAAGPKSSDSEQKEDAKKDLADQSEAHKQPADTVGEPEPEAEMSYETQPENTE